MRIVVIPERGELVSAVHAAMQRLRRSDVGPRVVINLALQPPNTLLHDGHRWSRYSATHIRALTDEALRAARRADFLVHTGYVFTGAVEGPAGDRLQPIIAASLEAEDRVLNARVPSCVLRLAYLYGPGSRDLRSYRLAFRLARPYWAGPKHVKQRFLHTSDAAEAVLAAARQRSSGRLLHASDNQATSFGTFMDHFARLIGNPLPLHLPEISRPFSHAVVGEPHMQMVELDSANAPMDPRPRGFEPVYPTYRSGLRQVVDSWS